MMKILNKFEAVSLNKQQCAVGSSYTISDIDDDSVENIPRYRSMYQYRTVLYVRFSANTQEYPDALDNAKRQIIDNLYGEVLSALQSIETEVYAGDTRSAVTMINELRTKIREIE